MGLKNSEISDLHQIRVYKQLVVPLVDAKPVSVLIIRWKSRSLCLCLGRRNGFLVIQRSCYYSYCGAVVHDTLCSGRLLLLLLRQYFPLKRKIYHLTHCTISKLVTAI
jgi:hypothetical protein